MKLPAVDTHAGRRYHGGGPGSPSAPAAENSAYIQGGELRAESSYPGPGPTQDPIDPLPPRAESTPPDHPDDVKIRYMGTDGAAWPRGNARGQRAGGSGTWAVSKEAAGNLMPHSPLFANAQKDSARSYLWAHRSVAHAKFKGRAAAGDGKLLPTASGKRLDQRLSRSHSPALPGSTAWDAAPGGLAEQGGTPMDWQELQHAAAMAGASLVHAQPNAALAQIELGPGQTGSLSPEHLKAVHGMSETDVQRLYRAMRVYTLGFHEVMEDISQRATDRRGLLVKVWRLFGRLWDSSLQVVFDSEVLALGAEREQALLEIDMLQRELEAARAENGMLRSKVNEMVNHALTTAEQDRHTSSSSARLVEELDRAQRSLAELELQVASGTDSLAQMDKELSRTRKELYKAQALLRSRQDDLEASRAEMSRVRGEGDELRNELNETRAEVMMLKERLEEAEARCKEAMEEKEAARKLADAARHDMFEERRAKRLLQVDVEYVRGEIVERREEANKLAGEIQGCVDAKVTAERQLREEIAFRQRETDRAEMYERDIQALVVTFNHLQDEVVLNTELKEEVRCVQTLLEAKRAKKRAWKEKCRELSHLVATMKHEGEEWRNIRDAEIKQHKTEVAALIEDIKKVEGVNKELHARLKPLHLEVTDMTQRLSQVQLARNTAKLRMEAANRRTAKLVDALADNIRLLAIERDKSARLGDELATKKSILEQVQADMKYTAEEHAVEVARLNGEIQKGRMEGTKFEAQMQYIREQAEATGSELTQQAEEMNRTMMEMQGAMEELRTEVARKKHQLERAEGRVKEVEEEMRRLQGRLKEADSVEEELVATIALKDKYARWLGGVSNEVRKMKVEMAQFLFSEPTAPVGDDRAWSGVAEGVLGSAVGSELETEKLVVDLDNHWDELVSEKEKLMAVVRSIREDRDNVKDQLGELIIKSEDTEKELSEQAEQCRRETMAVATEIARAKEEKEFLRREIDRLNAVAGNLERQMEVKEKELQDVQGELSRLKAANEALMEGDVRASQSAEQMSERLARLEAGKAAAEDEARRLKAALDDTVQTAEELEKVKARLVEYVEVIETLTTEDSQKVAKIQQLQAENAKMKVLECELQQTISELKHVNQQLAEARAALSAVEEELSNAQARASHDAGLVANVLGRENVEGLEAKLPGAEAARRMQEQHMAEIKKLEESHAAEMRKADEDHKRELEELMTRLRDSLPGDEVIRLRAELEAAATERDELQESKNTAYRSLVQIEDELADARRRVSELEAKLRQQDGGQAGALSTIGSELASMQEEIREAGNRFVYLSKAAGARELQEVWCGSMLQQVEGDSTLQLRWSRTSLCKIIGHLYRSKIAADLSDLADGSAVQTMREFVYDFFLIKTGLRVMAEIHLSGFIHSIHDEKGSSRRIDMFGSLVNHSSCPRLPPDVERVYLSVLSQVYAKTGGSISPREIEEGRSDIPLDAIAAAAKKALPSMEWAALESSLVSAGKGGKSVDLDEAMDLVMNEWTEQCRREEKQAEELFRRFDRNKDDLMSLDEFGALVAHVEGSDGSEQRVKDLFDLLVKEIGGVFPDKVCCAVFRKTAWRIGLGGGSRSTKVENPLPLPEQPSFLEGSTMIRDLVPTLASALKEVCDALKEVKSIASELDNMQKLFSLVRDAVKLDDAKRDREVWLPYRRFLLLLHVSNSREMVLAHESKAELGASAFSTTLREGFT